MPVKVNHMQQKIRGYTLIEMVIAITVFSVLIAGGIGVYKLYTKNKATQIVATNTGLAVNYIGNFLIQQGRYPCPARSDLPSTDPNYGMETTCDNTAPGYENVTPGQCVNGLCAELSERTNVNIGTVAAPVLIQPRVRRGMLPFRTLGLPEKFAEDGYKMRLQYAVTEILASPQTYANANGGISVIDGQGNSAVAPAGSAHFIIFSAGEDRAGAFTRFGGQPVPCVSTRLDGENCNTTSDNRAIYRAAEYSTSSGSARFDDTVRFYTSTETPLWRVANEAGTNIRDMTGAGGVPSQVGVGIPTPTESLQVAGNIKSSGDLMTDGICGPTGDDCFPAELIGGDHPNMKCPKPVGHPDYDPTEIYVTAVGDSEVTCGKTADIRCPSGSVVSGLNADGTLNCQPYTPPPQCPPLTITECGNTHTWPAAPENTRIDTLGFLDFSNNNGERAFGYECKMNTTTNVLEWVQIYQAGICVCVPTITPGGPPNVSCGHACQSQGTWNGVPYWQGWWTGDACFQWGNDCSGAGSLPWVPVSNTCQCAPQVNTETTPCPNGAAGSITMQRTYTCGADLTQVGTWTNWVEISNTCAACTPQTATQPVACPAGTGTAGETWTQSRTMACPSGTWGAWTPAAPPAGSCQGCNASATRTRTKGCDPGFSGSYQQTDTWNCGTNSWANNWQPAIAPAGACVPASYHWKDRSNYAGPFASNPGGPSRGSACTTQGASTTCVIPSSGQFMSATCICE